MLGFRQKVVVVGRRYDQQFDCDFVRVAPMQDLIGLKQDGKGDIKVTSTGEFVFPEGAKTGDILLKTGFGYTRPLLGRKSAPDLVPEQA